MKNEINLEKYAIRTDLLIESNNFIDGKHSKKTIINKNINIENITIDKVLSQKTSKKIGKYTTISFNDITDRDNFKEVKEILFKEIKTFLAEMNIKKEDKVLVVGLGNNKSTADSLGPKTIENIIVTSHLFILKEIVEKNYMNVSKIIPDVMANTGLEASDIIKSIVKDNKYDLIIVIDALASSNIDRINKTIQLTNSGINPGSGIGNNRKEISKETLGAKVLAIGIPTVVDANVIVNDTINYLFKKVAYLKNNINNNALKLTINKNYLDNNNFLSKKDKEKVMGIVGTLSDENRKKLIYEVLNPIGYNFMVTVKEIDYLIDKMSLLLGESINKALHGI